MKQARDNTWAGMGSRDQNTEILKVTVRSYRGDFSREKT